MEIIKRKFLLNKKKGKESEEESFFTVKIPLHQTINNLGLMTDMEPFFLGLPSEFIDKGVISDYYKQGGTVTYGSDSKLEVVRSYNNDNPYIEGFDVNRETYRNYKNEVIVNAVDRVININGNEVRYVVDANRDSNIGTINQENGFVYNDNPDGGVAVPAELENGETTTKVQYKSEGWNETNSSIGPQVQQEHLLGIINKPEVESDIFIDRTTFSVIDKHLRLSEVNNLEELVNYGNGFYNINRD
jgi:hypothetical protein